MKAWFIVAGLLAFATWRAAAQGTVNFANGGVGVNSPVQLAGVVQPREGAEWLVELLLVGSNGASKTIGGPVPLQGGDLAGYFFGGSVIVPGVEAGATATFRVRAYDKNGVAEAFSNPITATLGGGKMPPPNLVGLQIWSLKAAMPQLKITFSQKAVTLSWLNDFPNAALEFSDSLMTPNWSLVTETPQIEGRNLTVKVMLAVSERYYRLRLK